MSWLKNVSKNDVPTTCLLGKYLFSWAGSKICLRTTFLRCVCWVNTFFSWAGSKYVFKTSRLPRPASTCVFAKSGSIFPDLLGDHLHEVKYYYAYKVNNSIYPGPGYCFLFFFFFFFLDKIRSGTFLNIFLCPFPPPPLCPPPPMKIKWLLP